MISVFYLVFRRTPPCPSSRNGDITGYSCFYSTYIKVSKEFLLYADTILQLKAAREGFKETNLSVVTADGKLYSFLVQYAPSPVRLNYLFNTSPGLVDHPFNPAAHRDNERDFLENSKYIVTREKFIDGVTKKQYEIGLQLDGIYVTEEHIYLQLRIKNSSNLLRKITIAQGRRKTSLF